MRVFLVSAVAAASLGAVLVASPVIAAPVKDGPVLVRGDARHVDAVSGQKPGRDYYWYRI